MEEFSALTVTFIPNSRNKWSISQNFKFAKVIFCNTISSSSGSSNSNSSNNNNNVLKNASEFAIILKQKRSVATFK